MPCARAARITRVWSSSGWFSIWLQTSGAALSAEAFSISGMVKLETPICRVSPRFTQSFSAATVSASGIVFDGQWISARST